MLFDYRFQSDLAAKVLPIRCDLMLFDYRFQYLLFVEADGEVVI